MGRTAAKETAETIFSTRQHPGQHVNLQQLDSPATVVDPASQGLDCTVTASFTTLPQTNPRRNYHSLLRLMDANQPDGSLIINTNFRIFCFFVFVLSFVEGHYVNYRDSDNNVFHPR